MFAALADPTRRRILERLFEGERHVAELARPIRLSAPAVSRHLRVLEGARLIGRRKTGRLHLIRPRRDGLRDAQTWIARCAEGWAFSFDALDRLLTKDKP